MIDALETVGRPLAAASLKRIESPWKIPEAARIVALLAEMTTDDPLPKILPSTNGHGAAAPPASANGTAPRAASSAPPHAAGTASAVGAWGAEGVGAFFGKVNWKNERRTLVAPAPAPAGSVVEHAATAAFDGSTPVGRQSVRQFFARANWRNQTAAAEPVPTAPEPTLLPQRPQATDRLAATSVLASFQWD